MLSKSESAQRWLPCTIVRPVLAFAEMEHTNIVPESMQDHQVTPLSPPEKRAKLLMGDPFSFHLIQKLAPFS